MKINKSFFVSPLLSAFIFIAASAFASCAKRVIVEDISGAAFTKINTAQAMNSIIVIDVRPYAEYRKGHIDYAVNIPLNELAGRIEEIKDWKEKPVYLYADLDDNSFRAAEILVAQDFQNVYNPEGTNQYKYNFVHFEIICAARLQKLKDDPEVLLIDYRTKSSYDEWHIENARNIPVGTLPEHLEDLPKNKKIVIYSNKGSLCIWPIQELSDAGYTDICYVRDGTLDVDFQSILEKSQKEKL